MIFPKPFVTIGNQIIHTHLTPDEIEDRERARLERKYQAEVRKQQRKEVVYLGKAIPVWLAKMGMAYWYKKNEKDITKGHFNPIRIAKAQIGPDAYYFKLNTKRLPRRVFISDLRDERTLETLTAACESTVKFYQNQTGCWYSIDTQYGRGSIPIMVGYAEMLKMMPPNAPPLAWLMGMGENQRPHLGDMDKFNNLLIGGTKGGGKSNAANVMLCTFLPRNSPFRLRVFLTDLKGGIEFADYNGIPHLGGDVRYLDLGGEKKKYYRFKTVPNDYKPKDNEDLQVPPGGKILTEPHEVLPMLAYIEAELDRRARLLAGKTKKLSTYNKRYPDKAMTYWLVVIDELATLMEDARYKKQAVLSLAEIARKGRAVGIYTIMATQTPTSDIVPAQISNNMDARLAFRTGTGPSSGVLLGSGEYDAEKLPAIPGRFIFKWGGDKIQLQAPLIADGTIKKTIAELRAGKYVDARQVELAQKAEHLFKFALDYLGGECQTNRIYGMLKPDGFKKSEVAKILTQYEVQNGQPEIMINDVLYYLAPAIQAKRIPRWLVPIADFIAKKHPHPDYDFNLVSRSPFPENSQKQITLDSENPNGQKVSEPDRPIEQIDVWTVETPEPSRANGRQADWPPPAIEPEPILQNEEIARTGEVPAWLDEFHR